MKWPLFLALTGLTGCASFSHSDLYQAVRYDQFSDSAPTAPPDLEQIPDAIPKYEAKSPGGNMPVYKVRGKRYRVMESAKGFVEEGHASWYGEKFHGHQTSNGEIYDMYSMSAAHKHLPLPSYVKVTRLDTGKAVIVRVNDRGPFHSGRIIDLSYAAAYKLDMLSNGTSKVRLEAIVVPPPWEQRQELDAIARIGLASGSVPPPKPAEQPGIFLQLTATSDRAKAENLVQRLSESLSVQARAVEADDLHKIQLGPFHDESKADSLLKQLKAGEFSSAFKVSPLE